MSVSNTAFVGTSKMARVAVFYIVLAAVAAAVIRFVPSLWEAFSGGSHSVLGGGNATFGLGNTPAVGRPVASGGGAVAFLGAGSMLAALALMIPVTWVYMLTRHRRGYDESVVHTLLILPVTVAGIVMIVQNSLALAFSLAGIVAAVRFRTTLDDTKDAVYVFLAIGVGLACGVQAVGLALVLSVLFNGIILVLWASRFGNVYAGMGTGPGGLTLGDALAGPASGLTAQYVGDAALLDAASPSDLAEATDRAVRMERHLAEERGRKKSKRANTLILVHATSAESAQALVEGILDELSARWKLVEITPGPDGHVILEFLARLDGPGVQGAVMDRLRVEHGVVAAAELRSLQGLKQRT